MFAADNQEPRRALGLGGATLVISVSVLVSRLLGLGRETLIAATLGVSSQGDLYRDAFLIPDLLNYLLAGGFLSITLIPLLARRIESNDGDRLAADFSTVFRWAAMAIVGATAALMIVTDPLAAAVFPSLDHSALDEVVKLTRIALPAQIFFVLGGLFMAYQYVNRRFLFPALAPVIYNLAIIGGGWLGAAGGDPRPDGFVWGALVGAAIGSFALQWLGARRSGMRWSRGRSSGVMSEYLALAVPLMIGQSVAVLDEQFPRFFGQLAGPGGTAALSFARMLNMLPVGIVAQAIGVASFPFLARLVASGEEKLVHETTARALRATTAASLAATALVVATARPFVRLVFEWGAFTSSDSATVTRLLVVFALSIPAWGLHQLTARWFYAHRRMWLPVVVGTLATGLAIPVTLWLFDRLGLTGIAVASSIVMWIYTLTLLVLFWNRRPERMAPIIDVSWRGVPAAAAGALTGHAVAGMFLGSSPWQALAASIAASAVALGVFALVGTITRIPEIRPSSWRVK